MAIYEITGPDGSVYEITAPDDATEDQVLAYARQQMGQPAEQAPSQGTGGLPAMAKRAGLGLVRGARDIVDGGAQMLVRGANAVGLAPDSEVERVDQIVRDAESQYRQMRGRDGFDLSRIIGAGVASIPLFPAGGAGSLMARTAGSAGAGAGFGALQPAQGGAGFWREKAGQVAAGAAGGAIAAPVVAGLSRMISPRTSSDVRSLIDQGIPLTPGQVVGGAARGAEEKLKSVPVLGASIRRSERRGVEAFNRTAINRALMPIGKTLPKGMVGREAIEFAEDALRQSYDDIITKVGARPVDSQMLSELSGLRRIIANQPKGFAERLDRIIDNELLSRTQNGRLTGEAIKAAESNLGELSRGLRQSADYDTRTMGAAVDETQRILRSWLGRVAPSELSSRLKSTNAGWASFKRVQRAASSLGAEDGVFTAAQLQGAVKALDRSKDKSRFAKGSALMQDLSEPAKNVLSNRVPNSGTADRMLSAGALAAPLAGAGYLSPWMALGALPAAAYTELGQSALTAALARRPPGAKTLANGVSALGAPFLTSGIHALLAP